ncbi:MAG: CRISPR-associated endonuclease Cas3'' [Thermoplasmatales archaeon]|nr:CRISPR-associated endonuclease Cas3'' [Thermoplasmatales archaeon]
MKMLFSFKLKSHPNKLLKNHLENVAKLSTDIVNSKYIEDKEIFSKIAYLIGISHDFGKATTFFQKMLNGGEETIYANHGFLSSLFGYYLTKNHLQKIKRLEELWHIPLIAWIVINKHHGDIKNVGEASGEISKLEDDRQMEVCLKQMEDIRENSLKEIVAIYSELIKEFKIEDLFQDFFKIFNNLNDAKKFAKEIRHDLIKLSREEDIKYYFDILFLYSILLDADKLDASDTNIPHRIKITKNLIDDYKKIEFSGTEDNDINRVREKAYREVQDSINSLDIKKERILSINLPTGFGKTLTGLSFALKLREKIEEEFGFIPRIIYSLPFLGIIDQNAKVIEDAFKIVKEYKEVPSNLFLKHHHLADIEYKEEKNNELNPIKNINKSLLLTEGWYSEIIITTFVQLFHSLITNRNRSARKFHNIINSIIILDEIQSIPTKYWLLINKVLDYLSKKFNCWVILMTATEPLIFEKEKETKSLIKNREEYFSMFNRFVLDFNVAEKGLYCFSEEIYNEILKEKDKNIMVILNTIDACKKMYEHIKNNLLNYYRIDSSESIIDNDGICVLSDLELINLSTHILPASRLERIKRIKKDRKRKIIITTQLVEAGVDISVDIIYRDMAPLDCIIQSAGRCNRNNQNCGTVHVIVLKDDKTSKKYWQYIYDNTLVGATEEVIKKFGNLVSEKEFVLSAQENYYKLINERKKHDDSEQILNHLKRLNFSEIKEFKLIEELISLSIFVEIDEKAKDIREKVESILLSKNKLEKWENLLKIKKEFNKYILSIKLPKEEYLNLPQLGDMGDFKYIPFKNIRDWYKSDIGFQVPGKSDIEFRTL